MRNESHPGDLIDINHTDDPHENMISMSQRIDSQDAPTTGDFDSCRFLRRDKIKCYLLIPLLSLLTGFLLWIPLLKNHKFRLYLVYRDCTQSQATHVIIIENSQVTIASITSN